jgi:hypothetical protein
MNIQWINVISDVVGETGQKILRALVLGGRDGQVLAAMKKARIRASADEIAKSLPGNWRAEHLFALQQVKGKNVAALAMHRTSLGAPNCSECVALTSRGSTALMSPRRWR